MNEDGSEGPQMSEEAIIRKILASAPLEVTVLEGAKILESRLKYGRKRLKVTLYFGPREIETRVDNIADSTRHLDRETTLLYSAAKRIMQKTADEERISFSYTLHTSDEHMRDWAKGPGSKIFKWERTDIDPAEDTEPELYIFETRIIPNTSEAGTETESA
jgi:hypothetical protein